MPLPPFIDLSAIEVRHCIVEMRPDLALRAGDVTIEYVNIAPVPARVVIFGIIYDGQPLVLTVTGTFSQNVTIRTTFPNAFDEAGYAGTRPEVCRPMRVDFADGTAYQLVVPAPNQKSSSATASSGGGDSENSTARRSRTGS